MDLVGFGSSLTAFLLYYNTLDAGFVYDDRRAILNNEDILPTTPLSNAWTDDFWGTPISASNSHGSYRPLCVLSFRLNYILGGGFRPYGFHLVNVLLHCLATVLVVKLSRILFSQTLPVAVAGLLFATHPIHTEAVAGIVGRADVAACIFYLVSFISYINHVKYRQRIQASTQSYYSKLSGLILPPKNLTMCECSYSNTDHVFKCGYKDEETQCSYVYLWTQCFGWILLCLVSSACAMLTKETGLTVLVVCALYDCILNCRSLPHLFTKKRHRGQLASICSLCLTFCLLLMSRLLLMGAQPPNFASSDNPASRCPSALTRTLTFLYLPIFNFLLFLYPKWLSFDWSMDAIPRLNTLLDPRNLLSLFFYIFLYKLIKTCIAKLGTNNQVPAIPGSQLKRLQRILSRQKRIQQDYSQCPVCYNSNLEQHTNACKTNNNNNSISSLLHLTNTLQTANISSVIKNDSYKNVNFYKNGYYKSKSGSNINPCCCRKCLVPETCNNQFDYKHYHNNYSKNYFNNIKSVFNSVEKCEKMLEPLDGVTSYLKRAFKSCSSMKTSNDKIHTSAQIILIATSFLVIPFLPATNLFFYVGFVVAERILYIPSVGYCLLVSVGVSYLQSRTNKKAVLCAFIVLLCAFSVRTVQRNKDWNDEERLYRAGVPINPPKSYGNLGSILNAQGRVDEAEDAYRLALRYRPNMADVHYNLGVLRQGKNSYEAAIESYQLAIQYRPSLALAHLNLGQLLASLGRCEEAVVVLRRCSQLDGSGLKDPKSHEATRISALLHLGRLYADQKRFHKAISVYMEAVNNMPYYYQPQVLYNLLGDAHSAIKNTEEAEKWYKAALQAKPDHVPAHLTYGKLLAKNRTRVLEAEQWFLRAKKLAPTEPTVYQHFGQFLSELERHSEAAAHYVRAAELSPHEYEAVLNAATALRQADQKSEAEKYYRQAVKLKPEDARSHSNLGAMLHLNGKYKEAAKSYRTALKLQPDDVTTLANLHKLKSLMNKLET